MALLDSLSGHHLLSLSDAMKIHLRVIFISSSFQYQKFNKIQSSDLLLLEKEEKTEKGCKFNKFIYFQFSESVLMERKNVFEKALRDLRKRSKKKSHLLEA